MVNLNDEKLLYSPKWSKYRISDIVRIGKKDDIEYHIKNFKNTLVHQYIISHKKKYPTSNYGRSNPLHTNSNKKKSFKVSIKDIKLLKSLVDNMFNTYRSTISEIIGKDPTTINTVHLRIEIYWIQILQIIYEKTGMFTQNRSDHMLNI